MAAWDPTKFSNARVSTDRRYVPTIPTAAPLPDNDSSNAGAVTRREGERVAGFTPDRARDLLDRLPKGGAITAADMTMDAIRRGDVRGILGAALAAELGLSAPIKRGEAMGGMGGMDTAMLEAAPPSMGVTGAVARAGSAGAVGAASTAALWGGPMAPQDPTAWVGRDAFAAPTAPTAPTASTVPTPAYVRGAVWQTTDVPTALAPGESADAYIKRYAVGSVPEFGAANRGRTALTEYDLRVGVNGMADFDEHEGAYPEGDLAMGVPRRQDLGLMTEYPDVAWRALVSKGDGPSIVRTGNQTTGNQSGRGVAGDALARALAAHNPGAAYDARWSDGVFGHGGSVDAVFTGVWVDPYTGVEYDTYENAASAPTGDYRKRESGMQRAFEHMMGGYAPGRPQLKKVEVEGDWTEAAPDVDERDWVEYARLRGLEAARREDLFGPHADDAAWKDAEGYKSLPKGDMPANKIGYNDAVRFPAMPALHLHAGLLAAPMTGGGIQPGDGSDVPGAGWMPPQVAVRVKKAPVFSVRGGVGSEHTDGAYNPIESMRDPLRAPMRVGGWGEGATDGTVAGAEGTYNPTEALRDPLRAPVRIGAHGEGALDGGIEGAYMPADDVLTHTLSSRPQLVLALGRAFANIVTGVEGAAMPAETFPESLRTMAHNPMGFGRAIIDLGLTGPGTAGLADYSQHKATHRATDTRAMAIGDVGMALVSGMEEAGAYMPPELVDLKPQERDAVTLALGRAIVHMMDGAAVAGEGAYVPPEAHEEVRRQPAFIEALGRLAIQLADDAGAAYVPPEDWAAAQGKDRVQPDRSKTAWAREVGAHLVGIASEVEAAGTAGLIQFRDPLRGDSVIGAVLGYGIDTGVEGAGTSRLADPDAVRKRKLDQYALAIAARLYGLNAHAEDMGPGTAGLMEWTRRSRAKNDHPNLRGSAPFRIVDGHDGLRVGTDAFGRWARVRKDAGPNPRHAAADAMQTAAPTRETERTRYGHRYGDKPISTRVDNYDAGGGYSSAYQDDYSEVESKYMEVHT